MAPVKSKNVSKEAVELLLLVRRQADWGEQQSSSLVRTQAIIGNLKTFNNSGHATFMIVSQSQSHTVIIVMIQLW